MLDVENNEGTSRCLLRGDPRSEIVSLPTTNCLGPDQRKKIGTIDKGASVSNWASPGMSRACGQCLARAAAAQARQPNVGALACGLRLPATAYLVRPRLIGDAELLTV